MFHILVVSRAMYNELVDERGLKASVHMVKSIYPNVLMTSTNGEDVVVTWSCNPEHWGLDTPCTEIMRVIPRA